MGRRIVISLILIVFLGCWFLSFEAKAQRDRDEAMMASESEPDVDNESETDAEESKEDNPFLDRREELRYEDEEDRVLRTMNLSGVFYSGKSSRAIIDGQIVEIGDVINNLEIVEIKSEKVVLEDYLGKQYTVEMDNILSAADADEAAETGSGEEFPE